MKDLVYAESRLFGMRPLLDPLRPLECLTIQLVESGELTGSEETLADEANGFFDSTFFVGSVGPTSPGLEVIVGRELE